MHSLTLYNACVNGRVIGHVGRAMAEALRMQALGRRVDVCFVPKGLWKPGDRVDAALLDPYRLGEWYVKDKGVMEGDHFATADICAMMCISMGISGPLEIHNARDDGEKRFLHYPKDNLRWRGGCARIKCHPR